MTRLMGKRGMARVKAVGALFLGFVMVTGMSSLAATAETGSATNSSAATHTTVKAETREVNGRTIATVDLSVESDSDSAARGAVTLVENGRSLAGAALNAQGKVTITLDGLAPGDHSFEAVYGGDAGHAASKSESLAVHSNATATPDFTLAISASTLSIAAPGDSGSLIATVTPVTGTGFTGFISLSCSGASISTGAAGGTSLPVGVACTFAPANLEVVAPTATNATGAVSANLTLTTSTGQQAVGKLDAGESKSSGRGTLLAILLPGAFALVFAARYRKALKPAVLVLIVGVVGVAGTTGCNPRYKYLHHGPTFTGTVPGTYTITVTAQTSNGVAATEHSQAFALTVGQ